MRQSVRVCVIGDAGTGKTSLISTAANDTFDVRPPPVLPSVRLPREFSPDHVPILLTDTSSNPEDAAALDLAVQQADAVVICFDALRHATLDNIRSVWSPRVQQLNPDVPVILACCKADLLEELAGGMEVRQIREVRHALAMWAPTTPCSYLRLLPTALAAAKGCGIGPMTAHWGL